MSAKNMIRFGKILGFGFVMASVMVNTGCANREQRTAGAVADLATGSIPEVGNQIVEAADVADAPLSEPFNASLDGFLGGDVGTGLAGSPASTLDLATVGAAASMETGGSATSTLGLGDQMIETGSLVGTQLAMAPESSDAPSMESAGFGMNFQNLLISPPASSAPVINDAANYSPGTSWADLLRQNNEEIESIPQTLGELRLAEEQQAAATPRTLAELRLAEEQQGR